MTESAELVPDIVARYWATPSSFSLVLMDCHMPEMDGMETTRAIRARERKKTRVPIIALTADVLPENRACCLEAGMDGFLAKPVRKDHLREALGCWLTKERSA